MVLCPGSWLGSGHLTGGRAAEMHGGGYWYDICLQSSALPPEELAVTDNASSVLPQGEGPMASCQTQCLADF